MALSTDEKKYLDELRQDLVKRTGPGVKNLIKVTQELDLTGISADDLRELVNSQAILGIDLNEIDTSGASTGGKFTSTDMNTIAPGAVDIASIARKVSPISFPQARVVELVETQSGNMAVTSEIRTNADIEDVMEGKVKSQGINLQLILRASYTNTQEVANLPIKSRFLEE